MQKNQSIQAIGSFFEMTKEGYVINPTSKALIPSKWRPLIDDVVATIKGNFGSELHSIYLRGSVARGVAIDGFADLDIFVLLHTSGIRWKAAHWLPKFSSNWTKKYDFVKNIEVMCSSFSENIYATNPALAMIIKTQSLLLFGAANAEKIPSFKPSKAMTLNYRWLKKDIDHFFAKSNPQPQDVQEITKVVIRSGFEIVMERSGSYTTDLYPCYQMFAKYYPAWSNEMKTILQYYLNPTEELTTLNNVLHKLGDWLLLEIKRVI